MSNCQVWVGQQPQGYEASALRNLEAALANVDGPCYVLANFQLGGRELDAVVLKPNGIFLVELKRVGGPVRGGVNGTWTVGDGKPPSKLAGGNCANPYQQITAQYHDLTIWLEKNKRRLFSANAAQTCRFRSGKLGKNECRARVRSLLTLYPEIPKESRIRVDWKVDVVGLEEMIGIVRHEGTRGVCLTDNEMKRIIELLELEPWVARPNAQPLLRPAVHADPTLVEHSLASVPTLPANLLALPLREQLVLWKQLTHMLIVQLLIERLTLHRQRVLTSLVSVPMHE